MRPVLRFTSGHAAALVLALAAGPAFAQTTAPGTAPAPASPAPAEAAPPPAAEAPAPPPAPSTVMAKVNGQPITVGDLSEAAQTLPEQLRGLPPQMLYPMLLDQMIDRKALVIEARKDGLQNDPAIQEQMKRAEDNVLQNALLSKEIGPKITDQALHAKYDAEIANKPGEEEVHARHILVPTEEKAKDLIAQINKGAKFDELAKKESTEPNAAQSGGDLGFFKKDEMLPEFSTAAFALKPGEVTQTPVHTRYGFHVIQTLEKRQAPPQTFEASRDSLRQGLIQENIRRVVEAARKGLTIEKFNPDGTPAKPEDQAPPPAPPPSTGPAPQ